MCFPSGKTLLLSFATKDSFLSLQIVGMKMFPPLIFKVIPPTSAFKSEYGSGKH